MANLKKDRVKEVAHLARIAISEEQAEAFTEQLNSIFSFTEKIQEINTDNVQRTTHGRDTENVMRVDEPKEWITRDEALKNAPDKQDGHFKVPSIME
ncbi:Asp-tRNA(Asn)/Glu-tRNA(Gln) amidotransferase subunit GatC [Virgibacillus sp. W0181]|uniref:Asp-tRNA(Asn)/Glu-tRNA(Gln) amidotransferase subunit GatC n=1 Tax=Virgibacillus sp. W0181 TaxID=3391581 RepID=UPI003F483713